MEELPIEPTPEEIIEKEIQSLLDELYKEFGGIDSFDALSQELQDEWYWVEQEAAAGKNREVAKNKLKSFIEKLRSSNK